MGSITLIYSILALLNFPIKAHNLINDIYDQRRHNQSTATQRVAQAQDFDEFSSFLEGLSLTFPTEEIAEFPDLFPEGSSLYIQDLVCNDFAIRNIEFSHAISADNRQASIDFGISGISLRCSFNWEYQSGEEIIPIFATIIPNQGNILVDIEDVRMILKTTFQSNNLLTDPPTSGRIESCEMTFELEAIQMSGGVAVEIIDRLANLFRPILPNILETQICKLLQDVGSPIFSDQIASLARELNTLESKNMDPLSIQSSIPAIEASSLIDFKNMNYPPSEALFNTMVKVDSSWNRIVDNEVSINTLLRDKILNCDGLITLDFQTLRFLVHDASVYEGDESTPKINIKLNSLYMKGLDSFKKIKPLKAISKQTHEISLALGKLDIEANMRVELGSSSPNLPPDIIEFTFPNRVEEINFVISVSDIESTIAFFTGINRRSFETLKLQSVLYTNCSLSFLSQLNFTKFNLEFDQYDGPQIQGLISPGIDKLSLEISDSLNDMYNMVETIPILARTVGLEIMQNETMKAIAQYSQTNCPRYVPPPQHSFVDFRDLLLNQALAKEQGGSGSMPYGDLISNTMEVFSRFLLFDEKNGLPYLNEYFIGPVTRLLSNTTGYLHIPTEINLSLPLSQNEIMVHIISIEIENMNSTIFPLKIIQPRSNDPHILDTDITIGAGSKPLKFTALVAVEMKGTDFIMHNKVKLSLELKQMRLLASILAKVDEQVFMELPMTDAANPFCWAAMIPGPTLRNLENIFDDPSYPFFALDDFSLSADETSIDFECLSCDLPALDQIPQMIETLTSDGTIDLLKSALFSVVTDTALSPETSLIMNKLLIKAGMGCPHDPMYDPSFNISIPESLSLDSFFDFNQTLPPLSRDILEFAVLSGGVGLQALIAFAPQILSTGTNEVLDPLSGQASIEGSNETFLNFQEIPFLNMINPLFGSIMNDNTRPSGLNLQINIIMRTFFLNSNGILHIPLPPLSTEFAGVGLSLLSARIKGLDTFFTFDALSVIGPQTFQSNVGIESLHVDFTVAINMTATNEVETMTISFELDEIDVRFALLMALSQEKLINLQVGSLLNTTTALPCIFTAIHSLKFTNLNVTLGGIGDIKITGFIPSAYEQALSSSSQDIFNKHGEMLVSLLPSFFSSFVRSGINDLIEGYAMQSSGVCPVFETSGIDSSDFIDFRELIMNPLTSSERGDNGSAIYGDVVFKIMDFVKGFLLSPGENSLPNLNTKIIGPLTRTLSLETGTLRYPDMLLNSTYLLTKPGTLGGTLFTTKAFDARIENLNSIGYPLHILDPRSQNILDNTVTLGAGPNPIKFSTQVIFEIESDISYTRNNFDISITAKDFVAMISLILNISSPSFLSLPIVATTNLNCWLALIPPRALDTFGKVLDSTSEPNAALESFSILLEQLEVELTCISCTSPGYEILNDKLSNPEAISQMTQGLIFVQSLLFQNPSILNYLQFEVDKQFNNVAQSCPFHPNYSPLQDEFLEYETFKSPRDGSRALRQLVIAIVVVLLLFTITYGFFYVNKTRAQQKYSEFLLHLNDDDLQDLYKEKMYEQYIDEQLSTTTLSMLRNENVPVLIRYGIPICVFINIAFFLSGHIQELSEIVIYINLADEMNMVPGFYIFDIGIALKDLWAGPGKLLAIVIACTSIVWPYTKQLLSLLLWCLPPSIISVKRRGSNLMFLDRLAKWSIFDVFTFIMFIVAFSIKVTSRDNSVFLPNGFLDFELVLKTSWALYANLIAQVISQLYSHVAIYYHRRVVELGIKQIHETTMNQSSKAESTKSSSTTTPKNKFELMQKNDDENIATTLSENSDITIIDNTDLDALCNHAFFKLGDADHDHSARVPPFVNRFIFFFGIGTVIVLFTAASVPSFKFEISGVGGLVMASLSEDGTSISEYSLFDFFPLLRHHMTIINTSAGTAGLITLSVLLISSTVIAGLVLVILLLSIWLVPMKSKKRDRFVLYVEIIEAWHYTDVFVLTVFMISNQIGRVSSDMGKDFCPYDEFFATVAHFEILSERDARCFFVLTDLQPGVYLFILFSFMLRVLRNFVVSAFSQYSKEIKLESKQIKVEYAGSSDENDIDVKRIREKCLMKHTIQFSDLFSWLLTSIDTSDLSMNSSKIGDQSSIASSSFSNSNGTGKK